MGISIAFGRWNIALAALVGVFCAAAILTMDPASLTHPGLRPAAFLFASPYLCVVLLVAIGTPRAAAWLALLIVAVVLLVVVAARVLIDGDALALFGHLGLRLQIPLVLAVFAHFGLLVCAISRLRGGAGGGTTLGIVLSMCLLSLAALMIDNLARYRVSPQRAAAVSLDNEVRAMEVLQDLVHCLGLHQRRRGAYPVTLAELDSGSARCPSIHRVSNDLAGFDFVYGQTASGYELRLLARDPRRAAEDSYRADETTTVWHSTDAAGNGGRVFSDPLQVIQGIDICIEQYRLSRPAEGYPPDLRTANSRLQCRLGSMVLDLGMSGGFRYEYTPTRGADGKNAAFRLDVRPVAYGRPIVRSFLCTPQGTLHATDEDRAAELTDPDLQQDPAADIGPGRYCMGPEVRPRVLQ